LPIADWRLPIFGSRILLNRQSPIGNHKNWQSTITCASVALLHAPSLGDLAEISATKPRGYPRLSSRLLKLGGKFNASQAHHFGNGSSPFQCGYHGAADY
jgi:hypothetical protein